MNRNEIASLNLAYRGCICSCIPEYFTDDILYVYTRAFLYLFTTERLPGIVPRGALLHRPVYRMHRLYVTLLSVINDAHV